jgi:hypothetical protein
VKRFVEIVLAFVAITFFLCAGLAMRAGNTGAGGVFVAFGVFFVMFNYARQVRGQVRDLSERLGGLETQLTQLAAATGCGGQPPDGSDAAAPSEDEGRVSR